MTEKKPIIVGFSGFSGSGKTTLIEKLIPIFKEKGLQIAVIKHDAHDFEIDREGKDTWRFREAGADRVYISSATKSARMSRRCYTLEEMITESEGADIILVEGYKHAALPRIGVASEGSDYELPGEIGVYEAIVTDDVARFEAQTEKPVFHRDKAAQVAEFILGASKPAGSPRPSGGSSLTREASRPASPDLTSRSADENPVSPDGLTHFDDEGNARMVTVADKDITRRTATAGARVLVNENTFALIKNGQIKKGDVLTVAQVAGIMGAKRTPDLIPMCHPVIIDGADVKLQLNEADLAVEIEAKITCTGRTGVEMEAITACSVAAMTVYDMCKAVQRDIVLTDIRLLSKSGGIHGDYHR